MSPPKDAVPVYLRIGDGNPEHRIGRVRIDDGVYHPTGILRVVHLLEKVTAKLRNELAELEDPDDMSTLPLSGRRAVEQ